MIQTASVYALFLHRFIRSISHITLTSQHHNITLNQAGWSILHVCIPPFDPSYARTLTPCGTMVKTLYPTGLSPRRNPRFRKSIYMGDDKLKPLQHNPYIVSSGFAMDVRDWGKTQLREYQKMVAKNRKEVEDSYILACNQSNAMMAISGVVLAMIVPALLTKGDVDSWFIVLVSICIALSMWLSAYMSIKARRIIALAPVKSIGIIGASDTRQILVLAINADLVITDSHDEAIKLKRKALDWSLCIFIIGIMLLTVASIVGAIS